MHVHEPVEHQKLCKLKHIGWAKQPMDSVITAGKQKQMWRKQLTLEISGDKWQL